ncbi:nuclear transport factor 2 family protein [Limnoglobus roseus]|uniref:Nuclear transport factor 2 family protein n=1 Tax=Limnoglobus roseus TaxID=2598579 RepID=A0A5C1ADH1_9BACT|nr:nuclear transport factor 2 family protein [Limnoglobus roseus]QEL15098.1 nuclear transport factor 2 family protein [Limnoglobus roseus]
MDTPSENVAKLQKAYERWHETKGASVPDWLAIVSDDVILRSPGDVAAGSAFTGGHKGKGAVEAYFSGLNADWEMVHYTVDEFIEQGDRVVVLSRVAFKSRKTNKVATSAKADVFRFRGGEVVELVEFFDTFAAVSATQT